MVAGAGGKGWEGGILRELGIDTSTLVYLKWITNKDLLLKKKDDIFNAKIGEDII